MKIDDGDLNLMAMVINEPGFQKIEDAILTMAKEWDHVSRITGEGFKDGILVGRVEQLYLILKHFNEIRKQIKEKHDKG